MKSWKSRLLMAFTMLAVVLVLTLPAMAEDIDIDVDCEADGGHCEKQVSQEVWQEDTDEEDTGSEPQDDVLDAPVDEVSDEECSEHSWPPCGYYWPWPH